MKQILADDEPESHPRTPKGVVFMGEGYGQALYVGCRKAE